MKSVRARRQLLQRLEREAQEAPGWYRFKLALLALFGYAALGISLLLTLGTAIFLLLYLVIVRPPMEPRVAFPIIVLGALGVVILRGLWVRFSLPDGHHLRDAEAPELQREVERIRCQVGAAPLYGLVIDAELNAAAAFLPSGLGPWHQRHYLILGLPLLQLLDRDELAAVIAHEFGHFHAGHGRFAGWIYRLRASRYRVMEGLAASPSSAGHVFWLFLRWYALYFEAYSQALARGQEYEADAMAAEIAGKEPAARAVARIALAAEWLRQDFWPEVQLAQRAQPYPPLQVQARLAAGLRQHQRVQASLPAWLLDRELALEDSHPTLRQRLQALQAGITPRVTPPAVNADVLLGAGLIETLEQRFSAQWRQANEYEWRVKHRQWQAEAMRLTELEARGILSSAEAVEHAGLVERHRPGMDALPLYLAALERAPSHAPGQQRLGMLLLARGRPAQAIERLHRAMHLDATLIAPTLLELERHVREQSPDSPLHADLVRLRERYAAVARDPGAALQQGRGDELLPHQLEPAQLQAFLRSLAGLGKIASVWLARKPSEGMAALPHYVVLVHWAGSVASENAAFEQLRGKLCLPGSFSLVSTSPGGAWVRGLRQDARAKVK